jgi:uncharacterized protein DUF5670
VRSTGDLSGERDGEGFVGQEGVGMLLGLFVILVVLWLLGFVAFHVAGSMIHLLLLSALIVLLYHLFTRRRAVA